MLQVKAMAFFWLPESPATPGPTRASLCPHRAPSSLWCVAGGEQNSRSGSPFRFRHRSEMASLTQRSVRPSLIAIR